MAPSAARALARAGHTVYASMRQTISHNAPQVKEVEEYAAAHSVDLRAIELDVLSQESTDKALNIMISEKARIDVVIHNAGHMVFGPAEAFTPEQLAQLYDTNVISTQRVNRAGSSPFSYAGKRVGRLGVRQQWYTRRNTTISRSLFCSQGRDGFSSG